MKGEGESDEAQVASLKKELNGKLDVYDKILSKQPYLAGQVNKRRRIFIEIIHYIIHLGIYFG